MTGVAHPFAAAPAETRSDQLNRLAERIEYETGIRVDELLGPNRMAVVSRARQRLWLELRRAHWSLEAIGEMFGRRHHSTILYGVRAAQRREKAYGSGTPSLPFRAGSAGNVGQRQVAEASA